MNRGRRSPPSGGATKAPPDRSIARRVAVVAVALLAAALSLAWWRGDADRCRCEYCPDRYCLYADRMAAVLAGETGAGEELARFARRFLHAHNPLGPMLAAAARPAFPHPIASSMAVSAAATVATWLAIRASTRAWLPPAPTLRWVAIAFFSHVLVVRGFLRPQTDALGMACTAWALWATARFLRTRSLGTAGALVGIELAGLTARVSCIPLLGVPALCELALGGDVRTRLRRAAVAGLAFAVAPACLYAGVAALGGALHLGRVWSVAHRDAFAASFGAGGLVLGVAVALQLYGALGLAAPRSQPAQRATYSVHVVWIALYTAFLALGRGALWLRYWMPLVPSALVLLAGALTEPAYRRPRLLHGLVALCATANLAVAAQRSGVAGARAAIDGASAADAFWVEGGQLFSATAPAAVDGDPTTLWRARARRGVPAALDLDLGAPRAIRGFALLTPARHAPHDLDVAVSADGVGWTALSPSPPRQGRRGLLAPTELLIEVPPTAARYVAIRATRRDGRPWSVREIAVGLVDRSS